MDGSLNYEPMLSTFQVTTIVWFPERTTVGLAPSVKTSPVVEQSAAFASHVAICVNAEELSVPAAPVARVQVAAFQEMSPAAHVVAPTTGGVNAAAPAWTETFSCLVAVASTIRSIVTLAELAVVLRETFATANDTLAGTMTRACSLTVAVNSVV
jgi:hypothetical protein